MINKQYPYRYEIDTRQLEGMSDLNFEGFVIPDPKQFKSVIRHESYALHQDTVYIFPRPDEKKQNGSQIFIHIFKFPWAKEHYLQKLAFYNKQKKSFKLTLSKPFSQDLLKFGKLTESVFQHISFQTKDGKFRRRIVHSYENESLGLLTIFSLDDNTFDEDTFFKLFSEKCYVEL